MKNFAMQWQDKKVCFLGDSITDGIGVTKDTVYWSLLSKELGMKAYGYGLNGHISSAHAYPSTDASG